MLKLFKLLRPYTLWIILIAALIGFQAYSQLSLPDMMSRIINNGIYYEYVQASPYAVLRDSEGGAVYHTDDELISLMAERTGQPEADIRAALTAALGEGFTLPFTVPKPDLSGGSIVIVEEGHADYALFTDPETGRLLPDYSTGTVVYVDESGAPLPPGADIALRVQRADLGYILRTGAMMLLFTLAVSAAAMLASLFSSKVSMEFGGILRSRIFRKVESFSLYEFEKFGNASLNTRTTNDVTQVQTVTYLILRLMMMSPIMFAGGLIMSLGKSARMTMMLLITLPIILVLMGLVAKFVIPLFKSIQKKIDRLTLVMRESLTGVRVVRAFNRQGAEAERFDEASRDYTQIAIRANRIMSILMPALMMVMSMTGVLVVWAAASGVHSGAIEGGAVGDMMAVLQYVMQIMFSVVMLAMIFVQIPRASASAARINEVLETPPYISDTGKTLPEKRGGLVEFKGVTFSFSAQSERPALSDITFSALPGQFTAVVGSTGSGKSSLINLIPRLLEVTSGELSVDGVNVRDIPIGELRSRIGFVPQTANLFTGSIAENIRYGKEDATDEEIWEALETAQAKDFVSGLSDGLDHGVLAGGKNFSGGQKQRLAIARALVRKPEILIFDDSFSALDYKTDAALRKRLALTTSGSTVIVVAQRISTVMHANNIIVLDEGKIVGLGTHQELLKSCPIYREIAGSQLTEEELKNV